MGAVARKPRPKPVLFTVRLLRRPIPRLPKGLLAPYLLAGGLPPSKRLGGEVLYATPRRSSLSLALLGCGLERLATPYRE